jgi:hypothetical protein
MPVKNPACLRAGHWSYRQPIGQFAKVRGLHIIRSVKPIRRITNAALHLMATVPSGFMLSAPSICLRNKAQPALKLVRRGSQHPIHFELHNLTDKERNCSCEQWQ